MTIKYDNPISEDDYKLPDRIIYESLSEAKADNRFDSSPAKLYTTIIKREFQKFQNTFQKKSRPEPN